MNFQEKLAFYNNGIKQNSNNSSQSHPNRNVQQPRNFSRNNPPVSKIITPQNPAEPKRNDQRYRNDDSSHQSNQTKNTTQSSGNGFAAKLAFFKNIEMQNNQSPSLQETARNTQKNSNLQNKISMFNKLTVPLGQPTDYRKKRNSNYQNDENCQPQLVFPTELLTQDESNENQEMPFRRPVRFSAGRRRPTNLPDN